LISDNGRGVVVLYGREVVYFRLWSQSRCRKLSRVKKLVLGFAFAYLTLAYLTVAYLTLDYLTTIAYQVLLNLASIQFLLGVSNCLEDNE
jgi:heme/copper-type cytochrome/quinol oxidase subunit 4